MKKANVRHLEVGIKRNFAKGGGGECIPAPSIFCARSNIRAAKKRKMPRTGGKAHGNACYAGQLFVVLRTLNLTNFIRHKYLTVIQFGNNW